MMRAKYSIFEIPETSSDTAGIPRGCGTLPSLAKTLIVNALAWLLAWRPSLAMFLGRLVLRVWPNSRRG
jgi:hypothetical protein